LFPVHGRGFRNLLDCLLPENRHIKPISHLPCCCHGIGVTETRPKNPADLRNVLCNIAFVDERATPDGLDKIVLCHQTAISAHEEMQDG
jgi:hypothetical protein